MLSTPYSKLALIYDKVMAHVNYKMWAEYIVNLLQFSDSKVSTVLDIACGTARHIKFMEKKNIHITGADYSFNMLAAAKKNIKNINLVTSDARKTAFKNNSTDCILMLYDSINYMLNESDIDCLFAEIYRLLKPGGIFIFDVVTENGLKHCYDDYYESDSWDGLAYERHSWFSEKDKIQHNEFLFLYNGESYKEVHTQLIRDLNTWRGYIRKSKMHLSREFSNFSFLPPDKFSERVHFVCRKQQ